MHVPPLVTLHLWGIPARNLPWALGRMAGGRRALRAVPGLHFCRLLGTGRGRSFTPADADPLHWALLACWESAAHAEAFERSRYAHAWAARSHERLRMDLRPISSTGSWGGRRPFGSDSDQAPPGPCAVLTRARLTAGRSMTFWRAIPPVAADIAVAPGLRFARGIGEAPVGLQATFSVWDDLAAAHAFAYATPAHREVIRRTRDEGWYSEQLFARFAVIDIHGRVDGRNPLETEARGA